MKKKKKKKKKKIRTASLKENVLVFIKKEWSKTSFELDIEIGHQVHVLVKILGQSQQER